MITRIFLSTTALLAMANCTGSTDPKTATVFDNIANLSSGEYENQVSDLNAQSQAIIENNNTRRGSIASLERQRAANASAISSLRGQVSAVRAEIASARTRVSGDPAKTARLQQLDQQAVAVQDDAQAGGDVAVAGRELSQIRAAVRALTA